MADIIVTLQEGKLENIEKYLSIFNECKHEAYISHGEVLCGRATHNFKWADDILAQMKSEFTDDLTSENYTVLEILRSGDIVGFAIIELYKPEKAAVLDDIMIAKNAQGKGIGAEALRLIEAYLQNKNFGILLLESGVKNKGAHEFFEKNGFTQVSVEYAKLLKSSTRRDNP